MDNYPPGVTGNEWQIAGPVAHKLERFPCYGCFEAKAIAAEIAGDPEPDEDERVEYYDISSFDGEVLGECMNGHENDLTNYFD